MKIAYQRQGRFGKEFPIPLKYLPIVQKKETEKAICCGEYTGFTYKDGNPQIQIFGFIPKSQIIDIEGEQCIPAWILDKWNYTHMQYTNWINSDYAHRDWEVRSI